MEQTEVNKQISEISAELNVSAVKSPENRESTVLPSHTGGTTSDGEASCAKTGCGGVKLNGGGAYPYVYALGRVMVRFPSMGIEKEFVQTTARAGKETAGLTDQKALHKILSNKENRYLVRKLCWVLAIEGIDTYILQPRDPADFDALVEAIRPAPSTLDIDVVIGMKGPIAPPEMCNGLMVPIVGFDQMYSFDRDSLLDALKAKRPETLSEEEFAGAAEELLDRIMQMADNAGATDEHRALNYLAVRYDAIYAKAAEMHGKNFSLTGVEVGQSRLSGT
ncbi:MAG TPA: hypothetical protein VIO58_08045, partial [Candidatus Methanoperedens sp.]